MTCVHCAAAAVTTVPEPLCRAHAVAYFQALLVYVMQLPRRSVISARAA